MPGATTPLTRPKSRRSIEEGGFPGNGDAKSGAGALPRLFGADRPGGRGAPREPQAVRMRRLRRPPGQDLRPPLRRGGGHHRLDRVRGDDRRVVAEGGSLRRRRRRPGARRSPEHAHRTGRARGGCLRMRRSGRKAPGPRHREPGASRHRVGRRVSLFRTTARASSARASAGSGRASPGVSPHRCGAADWSSGRGRSYGFEQQSSAFISLISFGLLSRPITNRHCALSFPAFRRAAGCARAERTADDGRKGNGSRS
ncbi:hypothetical protein SAMN04515621_2684 [Erythrobacter sp. HL-111]|nr:hypothetical protein SAMN04515621_2684 [Erythrobacter sp. HL-111]